MWNNVLQFVESFKWNFKFVKESLSSFWEFFYKGFVLWHIVIEWRYLKWGFQTLGSFSTWKFSHLQFIWIKKHRMFVLTFMCNKMSSFQMESLEVMEKFDGGNFHLWKFKMCMMLFKHGLWKFIDGNGWWRWNDNL